MRDDSIAVLIKKAALEFEQITIPLLAPYDLTLTQYKILKFLFHNEDKFIRQVDIEQYFSMRNPTVTGIIQNLEKKELIERRINPEDIRSKLIGLTPSAHKIKENLFQIGKKMEKHLTHNLNEEEKHQLLQLLQKMLM